MAVILNQEALMLPFDPLFQSCLECRLFLLDYDLLLILNEVIGCFSRSTGKSSSLFLRMSNKLTKLKTIQNPE